VPGTDRARSCGSQAGEPSEQADFAWLQPGFQPGAAGSMGAWTPMNGISALLVRRSFSVSVCLLGAAGKVIIDASGETPSGCMPRPQYRFL
jgi:hypothetical protein